MSVTCVVLARVRDEIKHIGNQLEITKEKKCLSNSFVPQPLQKNIPRSKINFRSITASISRAQNWKIIIMIIIPNIKYDSYGNKFEPHQQLACN